MGKKSRTGGIRGSHNISNSGEIVFGESKNLFDVVVLVLTQKERRIQYLEKIVASQKKEPDEDCIQIPTKNTKIISDIINKWEK